MVTINRYLDIVLNDFQKYVGSQNELCDLLNAHYDAGKIPDYSNCHVQQLYLLRYAYAYAFEYKYMYRRLMGRMNSNERLNVTSIGCGNMLDYWSLSHAVNSRHSVTYTGIDTIEWSYAFEPRPCDNVELIIGDAISYFQQQAVLSSNVYMFPKSISEFSIDEIKTLAECFTTDRISHQTIHFMFSLRVDPRSLERDMNRTSVIYETLLDNGFHTSDKENTYFGFRDDIKGDYIRNVDDEFYHPSDVIDYIKDLFDRCDSIEDCPDSQECRSRLNRWPILKCQYAAWQIFSFER